MSLDLLLAGAAGGVVGAAAVLAAQATTAAVAKMDRPTRSTGTHSGPPPVDPDVGPDTEWETTGSTPPDVSWPTVPVAEATAHARLRARQLAEFADELAGDDLVLRERLRRFEGGLS